ncbi:caspase, EACC1-associated type [Streptomyces genisteinicus]|uniref:LysM peptidoglycan-binding domain-containing protein n=1 Tax=Streptomyces genisteinicus TaxID=2768068 RepID=A0A7H0HNG2_9ACTN|nr:LysM peptidoglycan-binding domain-containing protein [Streptomyces genisteinicus]QNP62078.1 LysM peptidoglycan-binding domain-containing protein [Streptomyces genisteinicus]
MHDPAPASRAVLIGAGTFAALDDLPAVQANVPALRSLFGDPVLHVAAEHCQTLVDPASPRVVSAAVRAAAREATDTLLVYYAGHGLIDPGTGLLHLAVPDSDRDSVFDTAVPYEWIKRSIETSGAARRIVILDCCYSARAFGVQSESVAALAEIDGTYLMAAAAETAVALSPPGEPHTAFTGELLDVLRGGVASPNKFLDLDAVFDQLARRLQRKGRPRPQSLCRNSLGSWPFARNNAYQPAPEGHTPIPDVARALDASRTVAVPVLVAQIGTLSEHRPATATEMVHTALQHRPVADLVRLFVALFQAGRQRHIEAALPAFVAARTVQECADLLEQLLVTPAEEGAVALLRLTAELKSAAETVRLATILIRTGLREHATALLSAFAVTRGLDETLDLADLACRGELDAFLEPVMRALAQHRLIADVIHLFEGMHEQQHTRHALELITSAARSRTATDTAEMITWLYRDGHRRIAEDIFHTGIRHRGPEHTGELIAALQLVRLTDAAALGRRLAVQNSTVTETSQLITHLLAVGQHQHALAAALEAARLRTGAEFVEITRTLDASSGRQGMPALLDEAVRTSAPDDVAHLVQVLDEAGQITNAAHVLWNTVRDRPPGHTGTMLSHLDAGRSPFTADTALPMLWRTHPPLDIAHLARAFDTILPVKADLVCSVDDRSVADVTALIASLETLSAGIRTNRVLDAVVRDWDAYRQARLVIALEERSLTGCAQRLEHDARRPREVAEALKSLRSAQQETVWQALTFWWPGNGGLDRRRRAPSSHDHAVYVVKDDDTVYSIATRYGVRWASIVEANDLPVPFDLRAGQRLRIAFESEGNRFVPPPFPRRLLPGRTHPGVRQFQAVLKQAGYLPGWVVDSDHYGTATSQAVARFNKEHGLSQGPSHWPDTVITHRGWDLLHRIARGKLLHTHQAADDPDASPPQLWSGPIATDHQS